MKYTQSIAQMEETEELNDEDLFLIATEFYSGEFHDGTTAKAISVKQIKEKINRMMTEK